MSEMEKLTDTQYDVLEFIVDYVCRNHNMPTCQVIANYFGWASPNAAFDIRKALEKKGYLCRGDDNVVKLSSASKSGEFWFGDIGIRKELGGSLWLEMSDGEAMEVSPREIEKLLTEYYNGNF